jgi:hypothetical protein
MAGNKGQFVKQADVLAWLSERGWPHDPAAWTDDQDREVRLSWGICGHRDRRQLPCTKKPENGTGRCKHAGARSGKGLANPAYRHGHFSRYMPPPLLEIAARAMHDGELLNAARDLALLEARLDQLLRRVDTGETGRTWGALQQEWQAFRETLRQASSHPNDPAKQEDVNQRIVALSLLVSRGQGDAQAWMEIEELLEIRRKFIETEGRRREKMQETVDLEEALISYRALVSAVKDEVKDPKLQRRIAERFGMIVGVSRIPKLAQTAGRD